MSEVWDLLMLGGVLMVPILAFSVVAVVLFVERSLALRSARVIPQDFVRLVQRKVAEGRSAEALTLCEGNPSSASTILAAGLRRAGKPRALVKEGFEEVGRIEVSYLSRFVELLGTIASVTPLLGLLGTVVGMIDVFRSVVTQAGQSAGAVNAAGLADGIWAALITTAAGLSVAIPAFLGYKYLLSRVDRLAIEMEEICLELVEPLAADALAPLGGELGGAAQGAAQVSAGSAQVTSGTAPSGEGSAA